MALAPIQFISDFMEDYPNYWLKAYEQGTTTPLAMAIDSSGSSTVAKAEISAGPTPPLGLIKTAGNVTFIPYLNEAYDLYIFPTEAEADANDTANAIQLADDVSFLVELVDEIGITRTFDTVALMIAETDLEPGVYTTTQGLSVAGDGEGANYIIVSSQPLGVDDQLLDNGNVAVYQKNIVKVGDGVKGNPQTNVGVQIHRDITGNGSSSHGFNCADYYAEDGQAFNAFGSDIQIGDGTQTTETINHVNSFQSTNQIDLNAATLSAHRAFIAQDVMVSGTVSGQTCFTAVDMLGVRDTPGFGVSGFDVASVVNNQVGIATVIRHGTNPRSAHFAAGATDAGATLTSGAGPIDCEGPIINRQNTASTSKTTGAVILSLGGIGCAGDIWANGATVSNATATYSMNSDAGTQLGALTTTSALTSLTNVFSGTLEMGVDDTAKTRLLTDRFMPVTDAELNLGDASHRWIQLFATTTTISTSDETTKGNILPIDDALLDAWEGVQSVIFQFKDALLEKGNDGARIHAGYIAQQVQAALRAKDIDGFRYALLCKDEVMHKVKKTRPATRQKTETISTEVISFEKNERGELIRVRTTESRETPMTERLQVFNDDGTPYLESSGRKQEMRPVLQDVPVMEDIIEEYEVEEPSGKYLMGLRYDQCAVIEMAYLRREIERLKAL